MDPNTLYRYIKYGVKHTAPVTFAAEVNSLA